MPEETEEEFEAFMSAIDAALTEQFGPNHQDILGTMGRSYAVFDWHEQEVGG